MEAAQEAVLSLLLETSIRGARGVIVTYFTPPDIDLKDINNSSTMIYNASSENVNFIWDVIFNENWKTRFVSPLLPLILKRSAAPMCQIPLANLDPVFENQQKKTTFCWYPGGNGAGNSLAFFFRQMEVEKEEFIPMGNQYSICSGDKINHRSNILPLFSGGLAQ